MDKEPRTNAQASGLGLPSRWRSAGTWLAQPHRLWLFTAAAAPAGLALGMLLGGAGLPLVQAAVFYPAFAAALLSGQWRRATASALLWAFLTSLSTVWLSFLQPEFAVQRIWNSQAYQDEMLTWIRTGEGPEGDIAQFLPQHLLHLAAFGLLTAVSAGFLGLMMGAALLNYMSFYVASLLVRADSLWPLACIAWPPWAICRVAGFVCLATALTAWVLGRMGALSAPARRLGRFFAAGAGLIVADILLKWLLAPIWRLWLLSLTGPG